VDGSAAVLNEGRSAFYFHVDDGVAVSAGSVDQTNPDSDQLVHEAAQALENIGFKVPDQQMSHQLLKLLGFTWESSPPRFMLDARKGHLLMETLLWITEARQVDVELLRSVVGVWLWGALLNRSLLALPAAVFTMMDRHANQVIPWWPSARKELHWMRQPVPAMIAEVGRPIAPCLFAADAEGPNRFDKGGFGVVGAEVGKEVAERVVHAGLRPGRTVAKLDGSTHHLHHHAKELRARIAVSRVPRDVLEHGRYHWHPVAWGRWRHTDHVTLGEARATNSLLERLAASPAAWHHVVACLEDNEAWSAACAKGRSPAFLLNRLLRRRTALQLASNIHLLLPWVDTAHQPADRLSRFRPCRGPGSWTHTRQPK